MIRNTFSILNGVGEKLERKLWRQGLLSWEDFLCSPKAVHISSAKKSLYDEKLRTASAELDAGNSQYFARTLNRREHWRLFETFRDSTVCLDIETNGLMPEAGGYVTCVGLYDGYDYRAFIKGRNLTRGSLREALYGYKYIITFFGSVFDLPFMYRSLNGLSVDAPHFDLCFGARKLGFRGGLKKLEVLFGIERQDGVKGMDGYEAVKLWEHARRGSEDALDLLVAYNREDTVNLFRLADILYGGLRQRTGIEEFELSAGLKG